MNVTAHTDEQLEDLIARVIRRVQAEGEVLPPGPEIMTEEEMAEMFRRSPKALRDIRLRHPETAPPYFKIGREIRYCRKAVSRWILNGGKLGGEDNGTNR